MGGDTDKIDTRDTFPFQLRADFNANQFIFHLHEFAANLSSDNWTASLGQYEELAQRFVCQPAGRKCHQQNLREVHEERESAEDRSRAVSEARYPLFIETMSDMPVDCSGRRQRKQ